MDFFNFAFAKDPPEPYSFYRAFYNSEMIQNGDSILDIGCGDGFYAKRFFSHRAAHVDAIDIDPSAIAAAERNNSGPITSYYLQDAVHVPFPCPARGAYDFVIWDGALGHFPPDSTTLMLNKIRESLRPSGVFAGSESLGTREGKEDHLQFFESLEDLADLFRPFFAHIYMKAIQYEVGDTGSPRREAYWRCSNSPERPNEIAWQEM